MPCTQLPSLRPCAKPSAFEHPLAQSGKTTTIKLESMTPAVVAGGLEWKPLTELFAIKRDGAKTGTVTWAATVSSEALSGH